MQPEIPLQARYLRNGWPSLSRPDLTAPPGWSLEAVATANQLHHHSLAPDGKRAAFVWSREERSNLYSAAVDGGWPVQLTLDRPAVTPWTDSAPRWSPDGRWLAYTAEGQVWLLSAAGGLPRRISDFSGSAYAPVWMPDSQRLIVTVERDGREQMLLSDREGSWPRLLVNEPDADVWDAQPSPDGGFVAYVRRPFDDLNRLDIRLVEVESGQVRALTGRSKERDWSPRWSPDGSRLLFLSERSGWNELWQVQPDGSGLAQLTQAGRDLGEPAWSPDGKWIACTVNERGALHLGLVDGASGEVRILRRARGVHSRPQWSPDGRQVTVEYESPLQAAELFQVDVESGSAASFSYTKSTAFPPPLLTEPEEVAYASYDGLTIPAFLLRPARPNGAAVVYAHGGPSAQVQLEWDVLAQYLVAKGYHWLAPNYRGSTGYGRAFEEANHREWGNGDMQDCLYGARFLAGLPGIEPSRIGIYGPSYGGYLTACALSRDPDSRFACGVSKYGDANTLTSWAKSNRDLRLYSEIFLGHPAENSDVYTKSSPIHQVANIRKPVLILHGLEDDVVPPEASEEWVEALSSAGKVFEYKSYAGEGHGFLGRATCLDAYQRIERFLDWYLLPGRQRD